MSKSSYQNISDRNIQLRREIENEKKASVIGKKAVSQHTEQPSPAQVILMKELIQKKSRFREQFIQINIDLSSKRNVLTTAIAKVELAEARQREANIEYENILKEKIRLNDEFNDICKELARIESRFPGLGASSYSNEGTTDRDQGDANGDTQESAGAKGQERCDKGTKMGVDEGDGAMDVLDLEEVGYSL